VLVRHAARVFDGLEGHAFARFRLHDGLCKCVQPDYDGGNVELGADGPAEVVMEDTNRPK
jgi:hypothetical protein